MSEIQSRVQKIIDNAVASGAERGIQVSAFWRGEEIVNAFGGFTDDTNSTQVTADTLFPFFSCGKGVAATVIHALVQQGVLDYNKPIAHYWPEFGNNGKEKITLYQALNHTAGLPQLPGETITDCNDWNAMCSRIAKLRPLWEPGSRTQYHAVSYGWLIGEPACRATGKTFPHLLDELVCDPLGINDLFLGLPASLESRVAKLEPESRPVDPTKPPTPIDPNASVPQWMMPLEVWMNRPDVHQACVPASNGISTAKALAQHYNALITSEKILSRDTLGYATTLAKPKNIPIENWDGKYGLGYALMGPQDDRSATFGHGGHGGTIGQANQRLKLAIAVIKNDMRSDSTRIAIVEEITKSVQAKL